MASRPGSRAFPHFTVIILPNFFISFTKDSATQTGKRQHPAPHGKESTPPTVPECAVGYSHHASYKWRPTIILSTTTMHPLLPARYSEKEAQHHVMVSSFLQPKLLLQTFTLRLAPQEC
uniref:Uncharacterized protein n=2 Tax=Anopheles culicifacies TaxID=139723 RepID=A0A182MJZ4_9DIPT